jgi:hypothetical protein
MVKFLKTLKIMYQENFKLQKLLAEVVKNLKESEKTYKEYISNGKTFRYAKELKKYNNLIIELLSEDKNLLPLVLQQDAEKLLHHYNTWMKKWIELEELMNPDNEDLFAFPNEVTFPREAAKNIESAYQKLDIS